MHLPREQAFHSTPAGRRFRSSLHNQMSSFSGDILLKIRIDLEDSLRHNLIRAFESIGRDYRPHFADLLGLSCVGDDERTGLTAAPNVSILRRA